MFLSTLLLSTLCLSTLFAFAVEVEPLRIELTGRPGQTVTGSLKVANHRAVPVVVRAQPGEYRYTSTAHTQPPANPADQRLPSCRPWVTMNPEALQLGPDTSGELVFTVAIPAESDQQASGEYVGAILVDETPHEAEKRGAGEPEHTVTIVPRIAVPLYLFLADRATPTGRVTALAAAAGPTPGTVKLLVTVVNEGRVHLRPTGTVLVTNARHEVVSRAGLGRTIPIFPRYAETIPVWMPLAAGRYTAVATVDLGNAELLQQETTFTVMADGRVEQGR